ncbi:hypothetical protein SKAU_G00176730 [Synaphobranchus kaupii]|uniref:Uncharacterized protein n=1 Tax=Synaphobranchus kaupii TaxID=118154 RepID=A0A9Q1FLF5_SYNKA|nr:hypothetical protein SKAU_G00176730 [Synaphobranchus kaupii]
MRAVKRNLLGLHPSTPNKQECAVECLSFLGLTAWAKERLSELEKALCIPRPVGCEITGPRLEDVWGQPPRTEVTRGPDVFGLKGNRTAHLMPGSRVDLGNELPLC